MKAKVAYIWEKKYLETSFLFCEHLIGFLVFFDELASQFVVFPLQLFLALITDPHSFLQVLDFLLFEGDGFLEGEELALYDGISGGKRVCLGFEGSDGAFEFVSDVFDMFVLLSALLQKRLPQSAVLVFEVVDSFLSLLVLFSVSQFFRIELTLMMIDYLLQGIDLVLECFLLVSVQFVKIVDMPLFFSQFFLIGHCSIACLYLRILESQLQRFDFFFEPVALAVENLPHCCLFLNQLFNFVVFIAEGCV